MNRLLKYLHTVRYLKPVQIYGRLLFRIARPRPDLRTAPQRRRVTGTWVAPFHREPAVLGANRFVFLNEEHDLTGRGWDDAALAKLWRYNLHYFDDLNATHAHERAGLHRELLQRWVRENPPARGTGWEPYPTSLRIVNWIKWALAGNALPSESIESLAVQTRWLTRRIERHILGNHLYANAKALVFAGLFFEGDEANEWLKVGLDIIDQETHEQILSDGGHFERSPMYHALMLEDVFDLLNVAAAYKHDAQPFGKLAATAPRMRTWLRALTHPDGGVAFFNDAAFGIAPTALDLEEYADRLRLPPAKIDQRTVVHLADSGYIRVDQANTVALLDVAPVSGEYLAAHAHADTLSFELTIGAQRFIVNSGTSRYGQDAERLRQRGTLAHSTVTINGQDSSEVWSGFRVARRARPQRLEVHSNGTILIRCSHDGYTRLPGKPVHTRAWLFDQDRVTIEDRVEGQYQTAEARFYLHPDVLVIESSEREAVLKAGEHVARLQCEGGSLVKMESTWHPRFGVAQPNIVLIVRFEGDAIRTEIDWSVAA